MNATQFRKDLYEVLGRATTGESIVITHKGNRFRLEPETPADRLNRLTPFDVYNPEVGEDAERCLKLEMQQEWEQDLKLL